MYTHSFGYRLARVGHVFLNGNAPEKKHDGHVSCLSLSHVLFCGTIVSFFCYILNRIAV